MLRSINSARKNMEVLKVFINGELWTEVSSLQLSQPCDSHYTVHTDSDGTLWITFGDGRKGKKPLSDAEKTIFTQSSDGDSLAVTMRAAATSTTQDLCLWSTIRDSATAVSFDQYEGYLEKPKGGDKKRRCSLFFIVGLTLVLIVGLIVWFIFQK